MKFPVLDYIRAIAVILVTYYHVITYGPHASSFLGPIADFFDVLSFNEIVSLVLGNVLNLGGDRCFPLFSGFRFSYYEKSCRQDCRLIHNQKTHKNLSYSNCRSYIFIFIYCIN